MKVIKSKQEAFEKWAHSPLRAAARRLFYICHKPGVATVARRLRIDVHNKTTTTTTTTRDRGDRYSPIEWAQQKTEDNTGVAVCTNGHGALATFCIVASCTARGVLQSIRVNDP